MPIIMHNGANIESVSAGPKDLVRLVPGSNDVDDEVWGRIVEAAEDEATNKKSKTKGGVLFLLETGVIKEIDDVVSGVADVSKMNVKEAVEVVNSEIDLDNLNKMLAIENNLKSPRKGVVDALKNQIELVELSIAEGETE